MTKTDISILKCWRSAVADSAIGDACLTSKMLEGFHGLSHAEAETGVLGQEAVDFLFDKVPEHVRRIAVSYRPLHVRRQSRHARSRGDGLPLDVTPVVTEAQVAREGHIIPSQSVIARDILDPLARGAFSVGRVADLDSFLTAHPFAVKEEDPDLWQNYQAHWQRMMAEVGGNWPASDPEYQIVGHGLIRPATEVAATVKQILDLSDTLIQEAPESPLLANFARRAPCAIEPARQAPLPLAERLGHSNDEFPVADHQREVLAHLAVARDGDILAVNGPPGTGKTTMLLSAIAGEWVPSRAAVVIPLDEFFFWRIRSTARLRRLIDGKHSGPPPPEQRLSRFQLYRATLMLRAWDGVASGASRQAIASILLNRDVQTLRAIDWKNAPERRHLARSLGDARKRIEGGLPAFAGAAEIPPTDSRQARLIPSIH